MYSIVILVSVKNNRVAKYGPYSGDKSDQGSTGISGQLWQLKKELGIIK